MNYLQFFLEKELATFPKADVILDVIVTKFYSEYGGLVATFLMVKLLGTASQACESLISYLLSQLIGDVFVI